MGGPGISISSTCISEVNRCIDSFIPGVRAIRSIPLPFASMPPATGGLLGPNRTLSSRLNWARTGLPY